MRRRQGLLLFYFCAAIGALILLAAGLPQLSFRPGRSFILNGDQAPDASSSAPAASMGDMGYLRMLLPAIVLVVLGYCISFYLLPQVMKSLPVGIVYATWCGAGIVLVADRLQQICDEMEGTGFEIQDSENGRTAAGKTPLLEEHSINAKKGMSQLRVQFTIDARYQEFLTNTEKREVLGQQVPVATLENIVLGKVWAWKDQSRRVSKRKKDELDLLRIAEAYPKLREKIPAEIVEQLK